MTLTVKNLTKSFGEGQAKTEVLKGINLEVQKGEIIVLNGASGSGKSTLISILGGLLTRTSGEITLDNKNYLDVKDKELTKMRLEEIGFIFQSSHLIPYLDITSQLSFVGEQAGMSKKESKKRSEDLLNQIGLNHRLKSYPHMLSGGEKQRVAIMRSLMNSPDLILADEPTASLDSSRALKVTEMIRNLVKENNMVGILITHDERVFDYADRIVKLEDGRISN
ncbi:ABC transporter ATP-binding protein [Staphylococcus nepalensis]|uniref:ABC transporter ATP-binding protein n=1 Tax=Staphylococcus nepalensis TaxID=214473 RepID=UPI002301F8AE|nr:ABC transporter ATP-binding protein [Staphylococcus nepalensis]